MEIDVGVALFLVYKVCVSCLWLCTSGKLKQSGQKKPISDNF